MSEHFQISGGDEDDLGLHEEDDLDLMHEDDVGAEMIERSPANLPTSEGYSDDPGMRRDMHMHNRTSHYMPPNSSHHVMTFVKLGCYGAAFLAVLTTGYFVGKSSNEKIDSVMGKIPGSGTLMAAASSPEADFPSVGEGDGDQSSSPEKQTEEDRMELLRASIDDSNLTLEEIVRESTDWDEDKIPMFSSTINISNLSDTDKLMFTFLAKYPFARDYVAELVMEDYTSAKSPLYDVGRVGKVYARLDSAFEAMELYEVDYEPVPILIGKDHPFMFVGSVGASLADGNLKKAKITNIVNWSMTAKCNLYKKEFEYMCMDGFKTQSDLRHRLEDLDAAVEYVEHVRKKGGKVLIHDWFGTKFSPTLSAAYLMKYEKMPVKEAIELIRTTRPAADPFVVVLDKYGQKYLS